MRAAIVMAVVCLVGCVRPTPARTRRPPPEAGAEDEPARPCTITTPMAVARTAYVELNGMDPEAAIDAAQRGMFAAGIDVRERDRRIHTFVSNPFGGQTLLTTCNVNHYRVYAVRIVAQQGLLSINLECWNSLGEGTGGGTGPVQTCGFPLRTGAPDSEMPSVVASTITRVLGLEH